MKITLLLIFFPAILFAQGPYAGRKVQNQTADFRSLSVINDCVIWAAGSKGTVCVSRDGALNFNCYTIEGSDSSDFRSLFALDDSTALIANAGSPARILRTADGGANWFTIYENMDKDAFIDGMDFWNASNGICYGDPINGRMMLLLTNDGGRTWNEVPEQDRPQLAAGEASFAASGTGVRCFPNNRVVIATGGVVSRLWISENGGLNWQPVSTPILQGRSSTGIFSFDFSDNRTGVITGGDYLNEKLKEDHVFYTHNGGETWNTPATATGGYRECVLHAGKQNFIAAGPGGIDISTDAGINWKKFSDERDIHVLRKARTGNLIIAAGAGGKIKVIDYNP
jgi:photosystem II stability/assembly factor-like uncharacterized protein